jgi:hypothetical protein
MERLSTLFSFLLSFFFLNSLLLSCEKGTGEFLIKGTITDDTFNQGLQGATASLYKVPIGTSDEQFVKSIVLPTNGTYEFVVPREKMERYILRVSKDLYFPLELSIYRQLLWPGLNFISRTIIQQPWIIFATLNKRVWQAA